MRREKVGRPHHTSPSLDTAPPQLDKTEPYLLRAAGLFEEYFYFTCFLWVKGEIGCHRAQWSGARCGLPAYYSWLPRFLFSGSPCIRQRHIPSVSTVIGRPTSTGKITSARKLKMGEYCRMMWGGMIVVYNTRTTTRNTPGPRSAFLVLTTPVEAGCSSLSSLR